MMPEIQGYPDGPRDKIIPRFAQRSRETHGLFFLIPRLSQRPNMPRDPNKDAEIGPET